MHQLSRWWIHHIQQSSRVFNDAFYLRMLLLLLKSMLPLRFIFLNWIGCASYTGGEPYLTDWSSKSVSSRALFLLFYLKLLARSEKLFDTIVHSNTSFKKNSVIQLDFIWTVQVVNRTNNDLVHFTITIFHLNSYDYITVGKNMQRRLLPHQFCMEMEQKRLKYVCWTLSVLNWLFASSSNLY